MDLPTPTPPPPISGYRSRAINAAVDFAAALRPVAGPGVRVADGPGGKTISVDSRGLADAPRPWTVRVVPLSGAAPSQVEWRVRVWAGLAVLGGEALSAPEPGGTDAATGLAWHDAPDLASGSPWLCVAHDGEGGWALAWKPSPVSAVSGGEWRAIARSAGNVTPPRLTQLDLGVVDLGGGGGAPGYDPAGQAKLLVLSGDGYVADASAWAYGDVDEETGLPTYPRVMSPRLVWREADHTLYLFRRNCTYNTSGMLVSVSAEVREAVFQAVPEMP